MKDLGIDKGLVQSRDTSKRSQRGWSKGFFGFRKMFWDYLKKLNVIFYDPCCEDASEDSDLVPAAFNRTTGEFVFYDAGTDSWITQDEWIATTTTTTTTTTTSTSTTTTTTAP